MMEPERIQVVLGFNLSWGRGNPNCFWSRDVVDLVHGRVQTRDGPDTPARTRCGGRSRGGSSSGGGWDRGVTSISRCAAAREKSREKFIGISSEVIDFRRVDGGKVTFVAKFVVVITLGPRDAGRVVAGRDRFQVLFIV